MSDKDARRVIRPGPRAPPAHGHIQPHHPAAHGHGPLHGQPQGQGGHSPHFEMSSPRDHHQQHDMSTSQQQQPPTLGSGSRGLVVTTDDRDEHHRDDRQLHQQHDARRIASQQPPTLGSGSREHVVTTDDRDDHHRDDRYLHQEHDARRIASQHQQPTLGNDMIKRATITENPMLQLQYSSQHEVRGSFHADRADDGQSALANIDPFQMYELRNSSIPNLPAPPQAIEEAKYFTQRDRDGRWATNPGSLEKQGKSSIKMPTDKAEVKSCFTFDCCSGIWWTWKFEHPRAAMLRNLRLDEKPEKEDEEEQEKEKEKEKEIGKKNLETSLSRAGRVDSFQRASDNAIGPPFAHSTVTKPISSTLAPDEEIIASVHVSAMDGLPSATNNIQVEGSIEIALVRSKSGGGGDLTAAASSASGNARMVFSVTAGTATISMREEFAASRLEAKGGLCACCFPTSCLNCCCPCYMTGNFFYDYQAQHSLTSQFFLLPVAPCVIDITAHSHSSKEFAALAESRKSDDDECRIPCCDCCACFACCCSCCQCCTKCSQFDYYSAFSGTSTSATCVDPIPQPRVADPVIRGVEWHVESRGDDGIFLVLHYKHHLSNNLRSCVMKLRKGSSFDEAKLFVAAVHKHTVPFPHDAMDVFAPAGLQPAEWTLVESFGPDGRLIRGAPKTDASVMPGCLEGCAEVLYSFGYHSLFCCFFYPCCPLIPRALPYGLGICALARILRKRAAQNKMAGVGAERL